MRKLLCSAFVVGFLITGQTLASPCSGRAMISTNRDDGTRVGIVMPDDAVMRSPAWMPEDGEPPLGISAAMKVSLEWATGAYARFDSVEVSKITLQRLSCSRQRNRWFYFVEFTPMMAGSRMYGSGNWAAVLMDGTVVGVQTLD